MEIDFSAHAAGWAPAAPADAVTIEVAPSSAASARADLAVCADGSALARGGERVPAHRPPGVLEQTVTFHDGTARTALFVTAGTCSADDAQRGDQNAIVERVGHLRESEADALIVVLHPFARELNSPGNQVPRSVAMTFEQRAVDSGADVLINAGSPAGLRFDIVRGSLVINGCSEHEAAEVPALEDTPAAISIVLRPEGTTVTTSAPSEPARAAHRYTHMLRTTVDADALLRGVGLSEDGGLTADLDDRHRVPVHVPKTGTGTTRTVWEDEPTDLRFDRSVPARMYMWERELQRRGATVETIGTRVLFGQGPLGQKYLVHITDTNRTGVPGYMASGNKQTSHTLLRKAGVSVADSAYFGRSARIEDALPLLDRYASLVLKPVDGHGGRGVTVGVSTRDEFRAAWQIAAEGTRSGILVEEQFIGEDVRVTVVDGVARAANQRVPPQIVGDGVSTVRDLINAKNDLRYDNVHLHSKLIEMTPHRIARLERAGLTLFSVLGDGETHVIDHKANLATGGDPVDVTDEIHPSYLRIAERAATAFPGMGLAGVDLLVADLHRPADEGSYIAVEVNSLPDIASHGSAFGGTPRNVVGNGADLVLAAAQPAGHVPRQHAPAPVTEPTSARLLAAEIDARGFRIDWLTSRLFLAEREGVTLGFRGAMTDRTSQAARMVLTRPLLRRRVLSSASLPLSEARTFGPKARARAWTYAESLGSATLQFGGEAPIDMHSMSRKTFDDLWADKVSVIRAHRALIASRAAGTRVRFLVVHGRVLSAVLVDRRGALAPLKRVHRSHRRLAADAARAFAGADIVGVSLLISDPEMPATAQSDIVEDVHVDPDLVAFTGADGGSGRVVEHLVDLHLGAARPGPEPEGVWSEDADRASTRVRSAARRAKQGIARRLQSTGLLRQTSAAKPVEHDGLLYEVGTDSARVIGYMGTQEDLSIPSRIEEKPVTIVAAGAFRGQQTLRRVVLPPSVTTLGADAFAESRLLEHVELPAGLRTINARAFEACASLRTVVLPTDLERIARRAFAGCTALTTLEYFIATGPKDDRVIQRKLIERSMPQSVEHIGVEAFENCSALTHIAIPHKATRIHTATFAGCTGLESVWLHSAIAQIDARAFADCRSLQNLHVPNALASFTDDSFGSSTTVECADGSAAHTRAVELGLAVAAYPPTAAPITSAFAAEPAADAITVRSALDDPATVDDLKRVYELRPAMAARPRRTKDRQTGVQSSRFRRAGETYKAVSTAEDSDVTLTMVGDLMCGALQQRSARRDGTYDFTESLRHVSGIFSSADLALANLETMIAPSFPLASESLYVDGRPHLNAPFSYLTMVRHAGIDAVLGAQNHMYDTGTLGILETLESLNDAHLIHGGMYASPDEPRHLLFSIKGMTIGVVAYLDPARQRMKKSSFTPEGIDAMTSLFEADRVRQDIAAAREAGAEFILAYCHWGAEYTEKITARQARFAQMVADAGADYIYGSHSHCPQPYTVLTAETGRQVPVVYSGGNFVAYIDRHHPITLDTFISSLTLTRDETGSVVVKDDGYLPCRIVADKDTRGLVSVVTLDELEDGALGYDTATARSDRARIASVLGPEYRSLARSAFEATPQ